MNLKRDLGTEISRRLLEYMNIPQDFLFFLKGFWIYFWVGKKQILTKQVAFQRVLPFLKRFSYSQSSYNDYSYRTVDSNLPSSSQRPKDSYPTDRIIPQNTNDVQLDPRIFKNFNQVLKILKIHEYCFFHQFRLTRLE